MPIPAQPHLQGARRDGVGGSASKPKCFRCGQDGHHQAVCSNPPACQQTGHISAKCLVMAAKFSKRGVRLCGYGIPGQGFFSLKIDLPDKELAKIPVRGVLTVREGVASVVKVENELKTVFAKIKWDWKVKQLNSKDFLITFPSEEARCKVTDFKSFDFKSGDIKASVVPTWMTEEAVYELVDEWVKIHGVPKIARNEITIKEIAELVGEFVELDNSSLRKDDDKEKEDDNDKRDDIRQKR
uniref:CCHC-type domain-containing protein n=1 Tax=Oryza brachyantha TaxID=4533 RepID=J3N7V8_ORYBR